MTNRTRIFLIILCILLIAASGCGIAFALMNSTLVSAEMIENTESVVNFNQLVPDTYTHNYVMHNDTNICNIPLSHKFYLRVSASADIRWKLNQYTSSLATSFDLIDNNLTNGTQFGLVLSQYDITIYNFMVIDLTQMFGAESANNITLEDCKNYFTSDYYNYTTGTPMPYSKSYLQGYQDAAKDIYNSMNVTYNAYTIGTNSFNYWNNNIQAGTFSFDNIYSAYTFSGVLGINLSANIQANTTINFDFELYIPDLQGEDSNAYKSYPLYIAYVDENNNLIQFNKIAPALTNENYTLAYKQDVVLPVNTSVIYIYLNYAATGSNTSPTIAICFKSAMTFTTTDIGLLMNNAYQRGANDVNALYAYGGTNWQAIYDNGYYNGLAEQNATLGAMDYIGAAFTNIGEILTIELLPGIPLSLFVLFPLMLGLLTFVVKLVKGSGD